MDPFNKQILLGFSGRFYPNNWRPAPDEIAFAARAGFAALQFQGAPEGLTDAHLGAPLKTVGELLQTHGLVAVMELLLRVDATARLADGRRAQDALVANLPAIAALGCRCVHLHAILADPADAVRLEAIEHALVPELAAGVALGQSHGFRFGFEHNAPASGPFATPATVRAALDAVGGLALVWDLNHTAPNDVEGYAALLPRTSMLHVADTRLPETNEHLPIGMGTIPFAELWALLHASGFRGPAILEIGGLPKSGGYGRDTDEALVDSLHRCGL